MVHLCLRLRKIYVYNNLVEDISSVGTVATDGCIDEIYIYSNKFTNVNHPLRIQLNDPNINTYAKKVWFYYNIVENPPGIGSL